MINVKSEYGKLKKVLLHRPGEETSNLTPSTYEELLFEDAYFLSQAQKEHDAFAKVLKDAGVEVVYIEDLVAEVFDQNPEAKAKFFEEFIIEAGIVKGTPLYDRALKYVEGFTDNKELVVKIIAGVRYSEFPAVDPHNVSLREQSSDEIWAFEPLPNLIFQRDPFASIGNGISLHYMANNTRRRETLFATYVFKYHAEYKETIKYFDRYNTDKINLEGGDVMVLTDKEIAVGISERTSADAIEKLAKNIFADSNSTFETIYAISIPKGRSWMHLDTVFTQMDKDKFSIFSNYPFTIFKISSDDKGGLKISEVTMKIDEWLKGVFGVGKVILVEAGGGDPIYAERDQWNDGSNVLAIGPSEVIAYDRNFITNNALKAVGVTVHEIPSYELSRGRGGPRCMSMPLVREEV